MEIHILLAGEEIGPFSEQQVREYMGEGLVTSSDLAMCEGMADWQPVDHVLANLPPAGLAVPDAPGVPTSDIGTSLSSDELSAKPSESAVTSPSMTSALPLTDSQKTKRKLSKIVIQPINPLEATLTPAKKNTRSGKTAIVIEPPRPTTSLPSLTSLTGSIPRERKTGKISLGEGQLLRKDSQEKSSLSTTTPPEKAPIAPVSPKANSSGPPLPGSQKNKTKSSAKFRFRRMPREILYTFGVLVLLILVVLIVTFLYGYFTKDETLPEANPQKIAVPELTQDEIPTPEVINPKTSADYSNRGLARQTKGDLNGAIADYTQAVSLDPKNVQAYSRRGLAREARKDWDGAIADYSQVLSLAPRKADAYSNRGFVKQTKGDLDGAIADYSQALLIDPKISVAYYNLGLIKVQKGDLDGAILAYNKTLDLDPKMASAYYNRGIAKNTQGNVDGAIADYTQAIILNPKIALAYCNRGFARQCKGDTEGALSDYAEAIAIDPRMAAAFYYRGWVKEQKGDLDGAIADTSQAILLDPKNAQAYYKRGLARLGKDNLDGALADLKKFCELTPRDNDVDYARLYIWRIATEENPKGNADQQLAASLQSEWNAPPEDLSSKIASFLLGHIDENGLITSATSPDPLQDPGQHCKAWYFVGMKRLLAGNNTDAVAAFRKCLATGKTDLCEYIFAQKELQKLGVSTQISPSP
jgi:tetratricopeptide (TPR) repeat protein